MSAHPVTVGNIAKSAGPTSAVNGDAVCRALIRVEDAIRTGKDTGLGHFPSFDFQVNAAWLTAAMIAAILLAWLRLLALDGDLARAEPKTLGAFCTPPPAWCAAAGGAA
jgi:hypothetical protein